MTNLLFMTKPPVVTDREHSFLKYFAAYLLAGSHMCTPFKIR